MSSYSNYPKISILPKLDITPEQEQAIKDFYEAKEKLPKTIDIKISLDKGKTWGKKVAEINLLDLIKKLDFE